MFGSPGWTRTSDIRINSPVFYQLNYGGRTAAYTTSGALVGQELQKGKCSNSLEQSKISYNSAPYRGNAAKNYPYPNNQSPSGMPETPRVVRGASKHIVLSLSGTLTCFRSRIEHHETGKLAPSHPPIGWQWRR